MKLHSRTPALVLAGALAPSALAGTGCPEKGARAKDHG